MDEQLEVSGHHSRYLEQEQHLVFAVRVGSGVVWEPMSEGGGAAGGHD